MVIKEREWDWYGDLEQRDSTEFAVIHHAAWSSCTADEIHRMHIKEKGFFGIGYHFFISKQGEIVRGRPFEAIGAHAKGYNDKSIGICLEGNLDTENVTPQQSSALIELLRYIQSIYKKIVILRHKDVNSTECPGKNFDLDILLKAMQPESYVAKEEHWAEKHFKYLNDNGIKIHERRFDEPITRGEHFATLERTHRKLTST